MKFRSKFSQLSRLANRVGFQHTVYPNADVPAAILKEKIHCQYLTQLNCLFRKFLMNYLFCQLIYLQELFSGVIWGRGKGARIRSAPSSSAKLNLYLFHV